MLPYRLQFALIAALLALSLTSCAIFDALRPALSRSALVFIQEIETLLREYEHAADPADSQSLRISTLQTTHDALYRNISTLLRQPPAGISKKLVLDYRRRLSAAEHRSSRNPPWPSSSSAPS